MRSFRPFLSFALCLNPLPMAAAVLELPADARLTAEQVEPLARASLPRDTWKDGTVESIVAEGATTRQAWQIPATGLTTLQLLAPIREQLTADGFETLFECEASDCGGFEFRYALDLLPEPAMHVDLGDFRYLIVQRDVADSPEFVALLVSRASDRGFIHVTQVGQAQVMSSISTQSATATPDATTRPKARKTSEDASKALVRRPPSSGSLILDLETAGRAVLSDLSFETGSARLADIAFESLSELAAWMNTHSVAQIVLVGHTDTDGALSGNIDLSRKRADAVRNRLNQVHGIGLDRMKAEGVGYLSPLSSNETEAGRMLNRRVEVVLAGES